MALGQGQNLRVFLLFLLLLCLVSSLPMDQEVYDFITMFKDRNQFCDYKCISIYNIYCFIEYNCTKDLFVFSYLFILPVLTILLTGVLLGKRCWDCSCVKKYFYYISATVFVFWILKNCKVCCKKYIQRKTKQRKEKKQKDEQLKKIKDMRGLSKQPKKKRRKNMKKKLPGKRTRAELDRMQHQKPNIQIKLSQRQEIARNVCHA